VTKRIDSQALEVANKALGLTGAGAAETELTDGIVDQVLSVKDIVRRSRTQSQTTGLYTAVMRTVHTDAETVQVDILPYVVPATNLIAPYLSPVPRSFDIWLLTAGVRLNAGGGGVTATLSVDYANASQGFGINDGGGAALSTLPHRLALWDAVITDVTTFAVLAGSEQPSAQIGLRLQQGVFTQLVFRATSTLTSQWDCQLLLGVFPVGLGQDALVG